jgi:hypothetical protein
MRRKNEGGSGNTVRTSKDMACKTCGDMVKFVDLNATAVTCFRCVSRTINPSSKFHDEMSLEEILIYTKTCNKTQEQEKS